MGNNGCCATQHVGRLAGSIPKSSLEDTEAAQGSTPVGEPVYRRSEIASARGNDECDLGFLRANPGAVIDVMRANRTIELRIDLLTESEPVGVLMPWSQYQGLIGMRDKIAAITGGMQPGR